MGWPKDPEKRELAKQRSRESHKKFYEKHPEEKQKLSELAKQQWNDPDYRQHQSEMTGQRMREGGGGKRHSAFMKEFYARPEAEALKQQARETLERVKQQPGYWERAKEQAAMLSANPVIKQKRMQTMLQVRATPEFQAKHKAAMDEVRQRPGYWESVAKGQAASKKYNRTDIELIVEATLQELGIEYKSQKQIGRWRVDFYVPSENLVIECDGDYWHSIPEVQERDSRKDAYLTQQGYNILRLLGSQIHAGELDALIELLAG